jgi:Na+-driven multidrug efflux pump
MQNSVSAISAALTDKVGQAPMPQTNDSETAGQRTRAATLESGGVSTATIIDMQTAATVPVGAGQLQRYSPIAAFTIIKNTMVLAILMAGSYTFSLTLIAYGLMAGRIDDGKDNVGAAGLVVSYLNMVVMTSLAGFYCVSAYLSEKWGELKKLNDSSIPTGTEEAAVREEKIKEVTADISRILKNCVIIGTPIATLAVLALIFSENILKWFGLPAAQSELAGSCLSILSLGMVFYCIRMWLEQIIFPFKKPKAAMFIAQASFLVGLGMASVLCYTAGLGLQGGSLGFSLEPVLTSIGFGLYILLHKVFKDFNFFNNFTFGKEDIAQIKTLIKGGWPITLTIGLEVIAMQVMTSIAGRMGPESLDAYTIASRPYFTALPIIIAFGQTTRQEVGRLFGQKDFLNMSRTAYYGFVATLLLIIPFCGLIAGKPDLLITIMTGGEASEQVREMVTVMARIFALGVILPETVRYNWLNVVTALSFFEKNMQGQVLPVIFSTGSLWLAVIVAWLASTFTDAGIYSVPALLAAGVTLGAALLGPQWLTKIRSYEDTDFMARWSARDYHSLNADPSNPHETTPLIEQQNVPVAPIPATTAGDAPDPSYTSGHYPRSM